MTDTTYWTWVWRLSQRAIDEMGAAISDTIPQVWSCDPLLEFEATRTEKNVFRFAVYILWLKNHPEAPLWFDKIREKHRALVDGYASQLSSWYPDIKREEEFTGTAV